MDIAVLEQWLPFYVQAALLTLRIGVIGTALAFVVGLICESLRELRVPVIGQIVTGYVEISVIRPCLSNSSSSILDYLSWVLCSTGRVQQLLV